MGIGLCSMRLCRAMNGSWAALTIASTFGKDPFGSGPYQPEDRSVKTTRCAAPCVVFASSAFWKLCPVLQLFPSASFLRLQYGHKELVWDSLTVTVVVPGMSSTFSITGGVPLQGEVELSGAKNAASKFIIASLLTAEPVELTNVPDQQENAIAKSMLAGLGAQIEQHASVWQLNAASLSSSHVAPAAQKNRLSVLALAPLLHRTGEAFVPAVGGDQIGPRPVGWHIETLKRMGAQIEERSDGFFARALQGLSGTLIELSYPSVGATETALFAAVLAKGRTVIRNAAVEPEIIELIKLLQKMGAIVEVGADRQITVLGVEKLSGASHRVMADPLEAASFACAALGTRGDVFVRGAVHEHLISFLNSMRRVGGAFEIQDDGIRFYSSGSLRGIELETDTWPGFRTDWQQPMTVVLTQATGTSVIHETVMESRFGYTEALRGMGADISLFSNCMGELPCRFRGQNYKHSAVIKGPTALREAEIVVPDIRAGLALVIAALVADGTSTLASIEHLDRGYERLEEKLQGLGARIQRA